MRLSKSHVLYKYREKAEAPLYIYILVLLLKLKTQVFNTNKKIDPKGRELFVKGSKGTIS
jgi:hypothetical protein